MKELKTNILILADAGETIGQGHLMRCRSIAAALEQKDARCRFLPPKDTEALTVAEEADVILLDSYGVSAEEMEELKKRAPLVYMDDLLAFPYPADMVINYNLYAKEEAYLDLYWGKPAPRLLLGPRYAPLRDAFREMPKKDFQRGITEVLLSTGGADALQIMPKILRRLLTQERFSDIVFHAVIGTYSQTKEEVLRLAQEYPALQVHLQKDTDFPELMKRCDFAVSAAGTTLHELAAAGVPAICFVTADNQRENALAFSRTDGMDYAGDVIEEETFLKNLEALLAKSRTLTQEELKTCSKTLQSLEDGKGAERIAQEILSLTANKEQDSSEESGSFEGTEG
ncbi:MAG: hypothetical protein J5935_03585 [Lachnospiraceae bacterium]|nr:hypothetical protein [Lachnospiraceae bacterium]